MARKILACLLAMVLIACLGVTVASTPAASPDVGSIEVTYYAKGGIPGPPEGKGSGKEEGKGYELLRGGVKWADGDLPVSYKVNLSDAPSDAFVEIQAAFEAWDTETSVGLFDEPVTTGKSGVDQDFDNIVSWAPITNTGIVAQCTIWFYVNTKEIIEFDIVFNSDQDWGIDLDGEGTEYALSDAFDVRNIATHEAGHTLHLGDLYEDKYSQMTMYGYTTLGEVKKISLEWGDINGLHKLYGS